jgi:hypothetical protein
MCSEMFLKCFSFSLIHKVCEFAMEYMANGTEVLHVASTRISFMKEM